MARLTGVATKTEGVGTTVVIETTEPVAYVAAQPDPLTLLVDLRNVAPGEVRPGTPSGAVADVAVESGVGRRRRRGRPRPDAPGEARRPRRPQPDERRHRRVRRRGAAARAAPAATPRRLPADEAVAAGRAQPSPGPAALTKVETTTGPDGTRVDVQRHRQLAAGVDRAGPGHAAAPGRRLPGACVPRSRR